MSDHEKQAIKNMAEAIATMSDEKKQYFIGFAEGVAVMAEPTKNNSFKGEAQEETN